MHGVGGQIAKYLIHDGENYFDSNMIQKEMRHCCNVFQRTLFAAGVDRRKCLHATSSKVLFCTHYVDDVNYHKFSHSDVSNRFNRKKKITSC